MKNTFKFNVSDIDESLRLIDEVSEFISSERNEDIWSGTFTIKTLLTESEIRDTIRKYLIE